LLSTPVARTALVTSPLSTQRLSVSFVSFSFFLVRRTAGEEENERNAGFFLRLMDEACEADERAREVYRAGEARGRADEGKRRDARGALERGREKKKERKRGK